MVHYDISEMRPAPCKSNPNRRNRFYLVTCDRCGGERWLRKSDAKKTTICAQCQRSDAGKLGYQSTVARFGADFAIKYVQKYRLSNPSAPERLVACLLDDLKVTYTREHRFDTDLGHFLVDFVITGQNETLAAIEVNGYHHIRPRMQDRDRRFADSWKLPLLIVDGTTPDLGSVTTFVQGLT